MKITAKEKTAVLANRLAQVKAEIAYEVKKEKQKTGTNFLNMVNKPLKQLKKYIGILEDMVKEDASFEEELLEANNAMAGMRTTIKFMNSWR